MVAINYLTIILGHFNKKLNIRLPTLNLSVHTQLAQKYCKSLLQVYYYSAINKNQLAVICPLIGWEQKWVTMRIYGLLGSSIYQLTSDIWNRVLWKSGTTDSKASPDSGTRICLKYKKLTTYIHYLFSFSWPYSPVVTAPLNLLNGKFVLLRPY